MTITYNPILDVTDLPRLRVGSPIRSPGIGTALVLEQAKGEPLVLLPGARVPDPRMGNYRRSYVVDIRQYGLRFDAELPSLDPSFSFPTTVSFNCQVLDPLVVVSNNIRDMTAAVRSSLIRVMRGIAQHYDVLDVTAAEMALNRALDGCHSGTGISLGGFLAEVDSGERSEIHTVRRETRIDEMKRAAMRPVVTGGQDEFIAQLLSKHEGDPTQLLGHRAAVKALEDDQRLEALRILTSGGEKVEASDTNRLRDDIFSQFLGGGHGLGKDPHRRLSRRSRVAGSLAPARPNSAGPDIPADPEKSDAPAVEHPNHGYPASRTHADPPKVEDAGQQRKPSRVRGARKDNEESE